MSDNSGIVSTKVIDRLPYPVAFPLHRAMDESLSTGTRVSWSLFASVQALRVISLPQISAYLTQTELVDDRLNAELNRLHLPTFYDWLTLARIFSTRLPGLGLRSPFGNSAKTSLDNLERHLQVASYSPYGGGRPRAGGQFTVLMWLRNRYSEAHDAPLDGKLDPQRAETMLEYVLGRVSTIAGELAFMEETTLWSTGKEPNLLRGHRPRKFAPFPFAQNDGAGVFLESPAGRFPVSPLLLAFADEVGEASEYCRVLDGHIPGRASFYVSPASLRRRDLQASEIARMLPLDELLHAKQIAFEAGARSVRGAELRRRLSARTAGVLQELRDSKYEPECHTERDQVDDALTRFRRSSNTGLLLVGEAGAGKTSLLCRLGEHLLGHGSSEQGSKGDLVVFVDGSAMMDPTKASTALYAAISDALLMPYAESAAVAVEQISETSKKMAARTAWVLIDGLNEAMMPIQIARQLGLLFLVALEHKRCRDTDTIRIVATTREDLLRRLRGMSEPLLPDDMFLPGSDFEEVEVRPFTIVEAAMAYEKAMSASAAAHPGAPAMDWEGLPPHVQSMLRSPLLLRFFARSVSSPDDIRLLTGPRRLMRLFTRWLEETGGTSVQLLLRNLRSILVDTPQSSFQLGSLCALDAGLGFMTPLEAGLHHALLLRGSDGLTLRLAHQAAGEELVRQELEARLAQAPISADLLRASSPVLAGGVVALMVGRFAEGNLGDWGRLAENDEHLETRTAWEALARESLLAVDPGPTMLSLRRLIAETLPQTRRGIALGLTCFEGAYSCYGGSIGVLRIALEGACNLWREAVHAAPDSSATLAGLAEASLSLGTFHLEQGQPELSLLAFDEAMYRAVDVIAPGRGSQVRERVLQMLEAKERRNGKTVVLLSLFGPVDMRKENVPAFGLLTSAHRGRAESYLKMGNMPSARLSFQEAVTVARYALALSDGSASRVLGLAIALEGLAKAQGQEWELEAAVRTQREDLELRRKLSLLAPEHSPWRMALAISLQRLGDLHFATKQMASARECYVEAHEIANLLARSEQYLPLLELLSVTWEKLGDIDVLEGDLRQARRCYDESLRIVRQIATQKPGSSDAVLEQSHVLMKLGELSTKAGRAQEAVAVLQEAVVLQRGLEDRDPTPRSVRSAIASTLERLGDAQAGDGALEEALDSYMQSAAMAESLTDSAPDTRAKWQLCIIKGRCGSCMARLKRHMDALEPIRQAISGLRQLMSRHQSREDVRSLLADCLCTEAECLEEIGRPEEALECYEEAIATAPTESNCRHELTVALGLALKASFRLSFMHIQANRPRAALAAIERVLDAAHENCCSNDAPPDLLEHVHKSHMQCSNLHMWMDSAEDALQAATRAMELCHAIDGRAAMPLALLTRMKLDAQARRVWLLGHLRRCEECLAEGPILLGYLESSSVSGTELPPPLLVEPSKGMREAAGVSLKRKEPQVAMDLCDLCVRILTIHTGNPPAIEVCQERSRVTVLASRSQEDLGRIESAIDSQRAAITAWLGGAADSEVPDDIRRHSDLLMRLGDLLLMRDRAPEALKCYQEAVSRCQLLVEVCDDSGASLRELADALNRSGDAAARMGDEELCWGFILDDLDVCERMVSKHPDESLSHRFMAESLSTAAQVAKQLNKSVAEELLVRARDAIGIACQLFVDDCDAEWAGNLLEYLASEPDET